MHDRERQWLLCFGALGFVTLVKSGDELTFDFTGTPSGSISQSGGTISANVAPGQYVSSEAAKRPSE